MAKLTDRTELVTPADGDWYVTTDVSDLSDAATGTDKKISWSNLKAGFKTYFDTLYAGVLGGDDNYVTDAEKIKLSNLSGTNTGDQTVTNSSDATTHTVTLSASGGSVQLAEGSGITLTTTGTASAGVVTIASTAGGGNVSKVGTPVNNEIGVWTGDGTIEGDAFLTWDTETLAVTSQTGPQIAALCNDSGAVGATVEIFQDSATPTANDVVAEVSIYGRDSAGNKDKYARIQGVITDATSTSEDGKIVLGVATAGTIANELELTGAELYPTTNDGLALGNATNQFSDLFLAEGGVINWDNGDATLTQAGNVVTLAGADLTVPNMTVGAAGAITLSENASIALDPAGSADGKYTGITITGTAGADLAFGDLIHLDPTDSRWELADANSASGADGDARGILGICVNDPSGDGQAVTVLLHGVVRADAAFPALTINGPVYVSETAGDITQTKPTTTDNVIRSLGYAITADEIYFNPSPDYLTHV